MTQMIKKKYTQTTELLSCVKTIMNYHALFRFNNIFTTIKVVLHQLYAEKKDIYVCHIFHNKYILLTYTCILMTVTK